MRKWCGWLLVGLVVVVMFTGSSKAQEAGSDAPYLYYYSDVLNAFVIERADGTDSRVLGKGLLPADTNALWGPGWSPSGKWFAWTSADIGGYGDKRRGYKPGVVSADGQRHLAMVDEYWDAEIAWSPISDLLLVAGIVTTPGPLGNLPPSVDVRIALIDPAANKEIAAVEVSVHRSQGGGVNAPLIQWTTDGNYAFAYYTELIDIDDFTSGNQTVIFRFDLSGAVRQDIIPGDIMADISRFSAISPTGIIAYHLEDSLVLQNLVDGEQHQYTEQLASIETFYWNVTGNYPLATAEHPECESSWGVYLWLFSAENGEFQLIHETAASVDWSPDGFYASFIDCERRNLLLDVKNQTVSEPVETTVPNLACLWSDQRFIVLQGEYSSDTNRQLFQVYDCAEAHGRFLMLEKGFTPEVGISADGRYLGFVADSPIIYDTLQESHTVLPPDGRSYGAGITGDVVWHENAEWMITLRSTDRAGGGGGPKWTGVTNADGSVYRDLGECGTNETCIGWLPRQVSLSELAPGQATSVLPAPDRILKGSDWSFYLSWSPDGRQIAFGKTLDGVGSVAIIDLETQIITETIEEIDWNQGVGWESGEDGNYVPTIANDVIVRSERGLELATSPDGKFSVIAGTATYTSSGFVVIDADTDEVVADLGSYAYPRVAFSPNGRLLVVSGPHERTVIWDTLAWQKLVTLNTNGTGVAFSPDGTKLAVASSWDIQIWEVAEVLAWGRESGQVD